MTAPGPTNDFWELAAAIDGDKLLYRIEQRGWSPPCSSKDLEQVHADALTALATDLPNPVSMADTLIHCDRPLAEGLARAYPSKTPPNRGCLRVTEEHAPWLRRLGIVEVGGCCLGAFGMKVRNAVMVQLDMTKGAAE